MYDDDDDDDDDDLMMRMRMRMRIMQSDRFLPREFFSMKLMCKYVSHKRVHCCFAVWTPDIPKAQGNGILMY